ncbi:MAG: FecR domain-containing protein [Bacteroidota bacterium]
MASIDQFEIPWDLIAAYLGQSIRDEEAESLQKWRAALEENELRFQEAVAIWQDSQQLGPDFPFDSKADWPMVAGHLATPVKPLWSRPLMRMAAVLIILLGLAGLWQWFLRPATPVWQEVVASQENLLVSLPDGSQLTLRAGSQVSYPTVFEGDSREIKLSGEAWLEVAHDPGKPFTVAGPELQVEVLGTAFAFQDYPQDGSGQVDLAEGKVRVTGQGEMILAPGQSAALAGDSLVKVDQSPYFRAWQLGELRFQATPLRAVIPALNRYYGLDFFLDDSSRLDIPLTATFRQETPAEVQEILRIALGVELKRER